MIFAKFGGEVARGPQKKNVRFQRIRCFTTMRYVTTFYLLTYSLTYLLTLDFGGTLDHVTLGCGYGIIIIIIAIE